MGHLSYTDSKSRAFFIISVLAVITVTEVAIALLGKGYIIDGVHFPLWVIGGFMIIFSIVKAYLIVYEFMHMKYEVPGLVKSVLMPTVLLIWAVVAFFTEGKTWRDARAAATFIENPIETSQKAAPDVKEMESEGHGHDDGHGHDNHDGHEH